MKYFILFLLLCLSTFLFGQGEKQKFRDSIENLNINKNHNDSIILNTKIISELSIPILATIQRHLEVAKMKKKHKFDFFIFVRIGASNIDYRGIPKKIIDSLYSINDFTTSPLPITDKFYTQYGISIEFIGKDDPQLNGISTFENKYYYNYNGYDVLICSNLNLIFKNEGKIKHFHFVLNTLGKRKKINAIRTLFNLSGPYVTEVRYKDLIWPKWTSKRNDFK